MESTTVLEILAAFQSAAVEVWLDGGWGVDALLGRQTRPHADLDLVVPRVELPRILSLLGELGFVEAVDERPTRLVVQHSALGQIDLHPVTFDAQGGAVQALPGGQEFQFPPEGFAGSGLIDSRPVPCLTPEVQAACHAGYEPDEKDLHDLSLLHKTFGLALPPEYAALRLHA